MRVVGMLAVFNEADIIGQVIEHLISQGIELVILDNASSDGSYEISSGYLKKGLLTIEREATATYQWANMLQRLYSMALEQNPKWVLFSGADEFLESPYAELDLKNAIEREASKGYNLIQFNNFEFWPTEKDCENLDIDVRRRIKYYTYNDNFQFRCWQVLPGIRVANGGSHYPSFPRGKSVRISPTKFVMRHYKIRSYQQGIQKVFRDRLPRFDLEEKRKGWGVHYDCFKAERKYFIIDSKTLTRYNEDGRWNLTRTFDGTFGAMKQPSIIDPSAMIESKSITRLCVDWIRNLFSHLGK